MKVNALRIRQSLGSVLRKVQQSDEPIIIEKNREPVAVLLSLKLFQERFLDLQEAEKREELLRHFQNSSVRSKEDSLRAIRNLRYGESH